MQTLSVKLTSSRAHGSEIPTIRNSHSLLVMMICRIIDDFARILKYDNGLHLFTLELHTRDRNARRVALRRLVRLIHVVAMRGSCIILHADELGDVRIWWKLRPAGLSYAVLPL